MQIFITQNSQDNKHSESIWAIVFLISTTFGEYGSFVGIGGSNRLRFISLFGCFLGIIGTQHVKCKEGKQGF